MVICLVAKIDACYVRLTSAKSFEYTNQSKRSGKNCYFGGERAQFQFRCCILVKVACLETFEEVMNGNNSTAVVAREEDKARSKHRRILKNSQNKTSLENAGGLGRSEPRNMDADPILNQAKTRSRGNTSQRRYKEG